MENSEKDNTKEAYNLLNYDLVYIILKENAHLHSGYNDIVKYDKSRKKYFLSGKVIENLHYPRFHTIALVAEKNLVSFRKYRKFLEKEKFITNVIFGHIDYITLPFDQLDWKR